MLKMIFDEEIEFKEDEFKPFLDDLKRLQKDYAQFKPKKPPNDTGETYRGNFLMKF